MTIKCKNIAPKKIAQCFINFVDRSAGDDITHLKLQKLVYYAQAWWLANKNEALFHEDMEAWTHGPVVPSLWTEYKSHSWSSLPPQVVSSPLDKNLTAFLRHIYEQYGKFSAKELEKRTHDEDPWLKTRGGRPLEAKCTEPIDKKLIRDYYARRINKSWSR